MPKWISVQVDDKTHRKIHTAAVSKGKTLREYVVAVLKRHAERLDVKVK